MKNIPTQKAERKRDWALTQDAFHKLLAWMDEEQDSGGEKYLEARRRLVSYFDRKNCLAPDELADETLNRVARRLQEEGTITDATPAHYCYIVAKYVFLEYLRRNERAEVSLDQLPVSNRESFSTAAAFAQDEEGARKERRMNCLERCIQGLDEAGREIIIQYYQGDRRAKVDNRRAMAQALGITVNALSIRACRLRDRLEACVGKCVSAEE